MAGYIARERDKMLLWMPADVKVEVEEMAAELGITKTAAYNIIINYGLEVHRLLQSQRDAAVAVTSAVVTSAGK